MGHWGSTRLSKDISVFSVLWARLFPSKTVCVPATSSRNEPNHTRSVRDRSLFLKCYLGIQSRSGKFITMLGHQAKPLRIPGNPFVFLFFWKQKQKQKQKTCSFDTTLRRWGTRSLNYKRHITSHLEAGGTWLCCAESCPTLCNLMDCSLSSSCVHGISQARTLEWVAISSSRVNGAVCCILTASSSGRKECQKKKKKRKRRKQRGVTWVCFQGLAVLMSPGRLLWSSCLRRFGVVEGPGSKV